MSETKKKRKRKSPVLPKTEFLTLAEVVEQTGWPPERVLAEAKWGYWMFCDPNTTPKLREVIIDDYFEHRK